MIHSVKEALKFLIPGADFVLSPFVFVFALALKAIRRVGIQHFPRSKSMLFRAGCFPVRDHYYEPSFNHESLRQSLHTERVLPGIDLNVPGQLQML